MDWFKLKADFYRDPALRAADREVRGARDLFLNGLGYCTEQETRGHLPDHALSTLDVPSPAKKVAALVRHGLLVPEPGGWAYRSWDRHQSEMDGLIRRRNADRHRKRDQRRRDREGQSADQSRDCHVTVRVLQEEEQKEKTKTSRPSVADLPPGFAAFWDAYPSSNAKQAAIKAYRSALKKTDPDTLLRGAERYRDDPRRSPDYTAHASSWLNAGRWEDDPPPSRVTSPLDVREVAVRTDW
jgi:hypothetical protein